jgi:hypothetical protein
MTVPPHLRERAQLAALLALGERQQAKSPGYVITVVHEDGTEQTLDEIRASLAEITRAERASAVRETGARPDGHPTG